jgi:hypothetical protein
LRARERWSAVPLADQSAVRAAARVVAEGSAPSTTIGGCLAVDLDAASEPRDLTRTVAVELGLDAEVLIADRSYRVRFSRCPAGRPPPRERVWLRRLIVG